MGIGLLGGHAADLGLHHEGGAVGQRIHTHGSHTHDFVKSLGIDSTEGHELVSHSAAKNLSTAERCAGDAREHVSHNDGGNVGVHLVRQQHSEIHEVLEAGTGVDYGCKAHKRGGQQQGIDAGEETGHEILYDVALEIFVVGDDQDDSADSHGGIDAVRGAHGIGQHQLQNDDNDVGQDGEVNGGQFLAAGAAGNKLSITFGSYKADPTGAEGIGCPGKVENTEAEGHNKEDDRHGGRSEGGDAQLFRERDAQHGGSARGDNIQDHSAVQENGRHQQLGDICFTEHGDSNRINGKNDDEGVYAAVGQQEGNDQSAGYSGLDTQETEQKIGDGFGRAALLHQFAVGRADSEQEQVGTESTAQRSGISTGQGPPKW